MNCWWDCKQLWKTIWIFLKILKIELPYNLVILLLGMSVKSLRVGSQEDICTPLFIAALVKIAMSWKQPKCPSLDEW